MTAADVVATMQGQVERAEQPKLYDQIEALVPQVERALGDRAAADRLLRVALTLIRKTPKLGECTFASVAGAVLTSGQLRLDPGAPLGHCWFIPMDNRRKLPGGGWGYVTECEWWLGYTGIVELARRSGRVGQLHADVVRQGDRFDVRRGTNGGLIHDFDPALDSRDRGDIIAAYCYWNYPGGGDDWQVKSIGDVNEQHREKSRAWQWAETGDKKKGGGKRDSPWHTDYEAMVRKSLVRASLPWLPTSAELTDGARWDERVMQWDTDRPGIDPSADDDADIQAAYQPEQGDET